MDINKYIRFGAAVWEDGKLFEIVKELARNYEIVFPGNTLKSLVDNINFRLQGNEDKRRYRKALQIFDLCDIQGNVTVRGLFNGELKSLDVDRVLFDVFEDMRDQLVWQMFGGGDIAEIFERVKEGAKEEHRAEVLFERGLTREIVSLLRSEGVFKNPCNPTNLSNPEGAFIYDILVAIGYPPEDPYNKRKRGIKIANKEKRDAVKNRMK